MTSAFGSRKITDTISFLPVKDLPLPETPSINELLQFPARLRKNMLKYKCKKSLTQNMNNFLIN